MCREKPQTARYIDPATEHLAGFCTRHPATGFFEIEPCQLQGLCIAARLRRVGLPTADDKPQVKMLVGRYRVYIEMNRM